MFLMTSSEKFIQSFLKQHNRGDLIEKFHKIISMARSRQEVKIKIVSLSDVIFQHVILYALFKKNSLVVPKSWANEIQTYLESIDALNGKKRWFKASQILDVLNGLLDSKTKNIIMRKLSKFQKQTQEKVKNDLDKFFVKPKLDNLGLKLKFVDDELVFFLNGIKI